MFVSLSRSCFVIDHCMWFIFHATELFSIIFLAYTTKFHFGTKILLIDWSIQQNSIPGLYPLLDPSPFLIDLNSFSYWIKKQIKECEKYNTMSWNLFKMSDMK